MLAECSRGSESLRQMVRDERETDRARTGGLRLVVADATAGGDFGFTAGTWAAQSGPGGQSQGSYVALWLRTARCDWHVVREARIEHAAPAVDAPPLDVERLVLPERAEPPRSLVDVDAVGRAMQEFTSTVGEEGLAAALRTYGRNNDFLLYLDGYQPLVGMDRANGHLGTHPVSAQPRQAGSERSADSSMAFSWGEFAVGKSDSLGYLQVWQYDPKVANWGLRLLLLARGGTR